MKEGKGEIVPGAPRPALCGHEVSAPAPGLTPGSGSLLVLHDLSGAVRPSVSVPAWGGEPPALRGSSAVLTECCLAPNRPQMCCFPCELRPPGRGAPAVSPRGPAVAGSADPIMGTARPSPLADPPCPRPTVVTLVSL